jgi:hypothetical protein
MDVKSAFLNGKISELVYVEEPPGFEDTTKPNHVYKLYRSLIGSLLYITTFRPDIMFSVCMCARFQATPKECHLTAV